MAWWKKEQPQEQPTEVTLDRCVDYMSSIKFSKEDDETAVLHTGDVQVNLDVINGLEPPEVNEVIYFGSQVNIGDLTREQNLRLLDKMYDYRDNHHFPELALSYGDDEDPSTVVTAECVIFTGGGATNDQLREYLGFGMQCVTEMLVDFCKENGHNVSIGPEFYR